MHKIIETEHSDGSRAQMKPVRIFMARSRASKSCLMAEPSIYAFWLILAFTTSSVLSIRSNSLLCGLPLRCSVALISP